MCGGHATTIEVAQELLRKLGRPDIKLTPVGSEYFAHDYYAPRAESEMLRNYLLELRNLNGMRDWREALKEYVLSQIK